MSASNTARRILIVDDEPRYVRLLEANLKTEGYSVLTAADGVQALEVFSAHPVDLILLDIMMPRLDGFGVCQRIREYSNVPIMVLTAKGEEHDRVRGLDLGADDYLVKPFSATEMLARVRAVLRRAEPPPAQTEARFFLHGDLRVDMARAEVWRGEHQVSLSATEYRLLLQFAHHMGKILTSEELLTGVWGPEYKSDKEILWVSIARLRQKLEEDAHNPRHIVTRSGLGYIMPPVEA
jgi:DNA-binding response OmpR family regulator